ncbi:IS701 family transposase [Streptomyces coeruleoprunus]|uniref:IS701 family transposase n=1 Tax=Streptomyces coeruleoprunus TaxID=285563 RepID=A0ABV9XNB5_9ACTN
MSRAVFAGHETPHGWAEIAQPSDVVAELATALFPATLRRRDQRRRAEQYVRGLLAVDGRKSMRNIATYLGGGAAAEQSLHHFIADSTWDWSVMREALARYLQDVMPPQAWVVQPMAIPKVGEHSVGVDRRFVPQLGQSTSGQHAFGVWFASEEMSAPVSWRLHLPDRWVRDATRRRRAEIPDEAVEETLEECASAAVLDTMLGWDVPRRPVVLGACGPDVRSTVLRYRAADVPLLVRVSATTGLAVADPSMPGFGAGRLTAQQIAESVKALRRPVEWSDPGGGGQGTVRASLVVAARVSLPDAAPSRPRRAAVALPSQSLLLLGEWRDPRRPPTEFWLASLPGTPVPALLRLAKLSRRVAHDVTTVGEQVGLRDFEGRSYRGWHRHITLASVAHTARALESTSPLPLPSAFYATGLPA